MAQYQIMRWKGIPSQVKAFDGNGEVSAMLSNAFQEYIDEVAMQEGLLGSDAYLDLWTWDEPVERPGGAQEVLDALVAELEAAGPRPA
ncbi:virulence factor [bacterium]|nr:virulence factor [bacterium]